MLIPSSLTTLEHGIGETAIPANVATLPTVMPISPEILNIPRCSLAVLPSESRTIMSVTLAERRLMLLITSEPSADNPTRLSSHHPAGYYPVSLRFFSITPHLIVWEQCKCHWRASRIIMAVTHKSDRMKTVVTPILCPRPVSTTTERRTHQ
jgi:hypothetical protein